MACDLRFELTLDLGDGLPRPNSRLWVDLSQDFDLADGEEIRLTSVDRAIWIGVQTLNDKDHVNGLFFVLRFVAPRGSGWTFTAWCDGEVVYQTQPGLTLSRNRETLTGYFRGSAPPAGTLPGPRARDEDEEEP